MKETCRRKLTSADFYDFKIKSTNEVNGLLNIPLKYGLHFCNKLHYDLYKTYAVSHPFLNSSVQINLFRLADVGNVILNIFIFTR